MKKNKNTVEQFEPQPKPVIPMDDVIAKDAENNEDFNDYIEAPIEDEVPVEYAIVKPVAGGLQPIISPKGQVQLNPIVVPVAFVPYATQNQPMMQEEEDVEEKTEAVLPDIKDQPLEKGKKDKSKDKSLNIVGESKNAKANAKKATIKNRIGSIVLMILNVAFLAFVIINHFADKIGIASDMILLRGTPDVIGGWQNFDKSNIVAQIPLFLVTALSVIALANFITTFVCACTARGAKIWISAILMVIISLVSTLLSAFGVFGEVATISKNPASAGTIQWLLLFVSAAILLFSIIFMPKKIYDFDEE